MKAVLFLALLGVAVASAHLFSESEYQFLFSKWIAQHHKKYNHENFFYRYTVFKRNMDHIVSHNKKGASYTMAMNAFGDMTPEEFKSTHTGYNRVLNTVHRNANSKHVKLPKDQPTEVDWREVGAVTPVKNQQQCGSCWAFSATGSLEGAHFLRTKSLVSLSEQQLVDCSTAEGNNGCNGGLMDNAFQYVIDNKGLCSEEKYPYKAVDGTCASSSCVSVDSITGFTDVTAGDEDALYIAAATQPISIAIEADQQVFQFYSGGILNDASCGTQLDHGVLVVGYGVDSASSTPFWIVKNSWGAAWGEAGYIRMIRGKNQCGLAAEPSFPNKE